jgi:hypothetical protein
MTRSEAARIIGTRRVLARGCRAGYSPGAISCCPPGHRPDRPRGHSSDSKWPAPSLRLPPTRFHSLSLHLLWPAPAREAKTPLDPGASDDGSQAHGRCLLDAPRMQRPKKSPILDRRLAYLTTHRSIRTLPLAEKGPLKFLYLKHLRSTKPVCAGFFSIEGSRIRRPC